MSILTRYLFLFALLAAFALAWRLQVLHQIDPERPPLPQASEAQRLFEAMREEDLLHLDAAGKVIPAPADQVLASAAAGIERPNSGRRQRLLAAFYYSAAGRTLAHWFAQWNQGRTLSAVRDNRTRPQTGIIKPWQPRDAWDQPLPVFGRIPLEFGYVLDAKLRPGFGPWYASSADVVEYHTRLQLASRQTLRIQVIGIPDTAKWPPHKLLGCLRKPAKGKPYCQRADPAKVYAAYHIVLPLHAGTHLLRLPVRAIRNPLLADRDLPLAIENNRLVWQAKRERYGKTTTSSRPAAHFILKTADGVALTDAQGQGIPSPYTLANGLAGLVGYGPTYRQTLSGLLARSAIADQGQVTLTLNSHLQTIAQQALQQRLLALPKVRQRRGAVVFLDAHTGAILAAADYPGPPAATSDWDRAAFAVTWPHQDPFRFAPWQGLDAHAAPGSTFKPVTAMAAIMAAQQGNEVVKGMLQGWSQKQFARHTQLSPNAACYQATGASEVCNFAGGTLAKSFHKGLRQCGTTRSTSTSLGVREAVRDSLNIWFVRLAEVMDSQHLSSGGPDTLLYRQALALGFGAPIALFPAIGGVPQDRLTFRFRGSVLKAQTGILDLAYPHLGAVRQRLSQNAFGQGVAATPLQMARVAAAVATGQLVMPTLLQGWENQIIAPQPTQALHLNPELLGLLRQGMKAVVETGTAASAFWREYPQGRCHTYGKTGTARTLDQPALFSAWFIGWQEAQAQGPTIAFACQLTHFPHDRKKYTGGTLCGVLVARILKQWQENHAPTQ